ncbi:hypothetical protein FO519_001570 [Halicephalobus sp. NKZ332]|nr:hypothetical protein FO519_001570 [Halicephalobus sp. NKZ332]
MNRLLSIFLIGGLIGFSYCVEENEHSTHRIRLMAKLCQSMPGESSICKRFSDPTETVFTQNSIYHFRSERDDSESLFPKRANPLVSGKNVIKRIKRQFFDPYPVMPVGYGFLPPLLSISSSKGGFGGGPFGGGVGGSNFQMTLGLDLCKRKPYLLLCREQSSDFEDSRRALPKNSDPLARPESVPELPANQDYPLTKSSPHYYPDNTPWVPPVIKYHHKDADTPIDFSRPNADDVAREMGVMRDDPVATNKIPDTPSETNDEDTDDLNYAAYRLRRARLLRKLQDLDDDQVNSRHSSTNHYGSSSFPYSRSRYSNYYPYSSPYEGSYYPASYPSYGYSPSYSGWNPGYMGGYGTGYGQPFTFGIGSGLNIGIPYVGPIGVGTGLGVTVG